MKLKNGKEITEEELIEIQNTIANEDLRQDILELTGYPTPENARDMRKIWIDMLSDPGLTKARAKAEKRITQDYWVERFSVQADGLKEFLSQLQEFNFVYGCIEGKRYTYEIVGNEIRLKEGHAGFPARLFAAYIKKNVAYSFIFDEKQITPVGVIVNVKKNEAEIHFQYMTS